MSNRLIGIVLIVIVAWSTFVPAVTAAPEVRPDALLQTSKADKEAQKQEAEQQKADAEAEKEARKRRARYGPPTVNAAWTFVYQGAADLRFCDILVSVSGYAPGPLQVDVQRNLFATADWNSLVTISIDVGSDSRGSGQADLEPLLIGPGHLHNYRVEVDGQFFYLPSDGC